MLKMIFFQKFWVLEKKSPAKAIFAASPTQPKCWKQQLVGILSKTFFFLNLLFRLRNKIMGCHADFFLFFSAQNSSSVELRRWLSSFLLQGARKLQRSCTHKIRVWWVSSPSCDKIKVTVTESSHRIGFHLHLLVFSFIYQFNSRIGVLVNSSFANDQFRRISTTFQC